MVVHRRGHALDEEERVVARGRGVTDVRQEAGREGTEKIPDSGVDGSRSTPDNAQANRPIPGHE
jgi:hypothetical protein